MEQYDVFLSYRRKGGDSLAQLLYDRLTKEGYNVFMDVESLRSGKFNEVLYRVIENCTDVLIVLPEDGLDRCKDENDWVRLEIEHALKYNKNIIPVMTRNFEFPAELPESLKSLPMYNGITASMELFDGVIEKLKKMLKSPSRKVLDKKNNTSIANVFKMCVLFTLGILCLLIAILQSFPKLKLYLNIDFSRIEYFIDEVFLSEIKGLFIITIACVMGYLIYKWATHEDYSFYSNKNKDKNIEIKDIISIRKYRQMIS